MDRAVLSAAALRRLHGALALLRSPSAGERDAAVMAALRVLDGAGVDWPDIIRGREQGPERIRGPGRRHEKDGGEDSCAIAAALLRWHLHLFNGAEIDFLANAARLPSLSRKQVAWLRRLAEKAGCDVGGA